VEDAIVSTGFSDLGGPDSGAAYLFYGPFYGPVTEDATLEQADAVFMNEDSNDQAGSSVAGPGDVNHDGYDDVLIGASAAEETEAQSGISYIVYGPASGTIDLSETDVKIIGENTGDALGQNGSGAGDVNDDGFADILIGAPSYRSVKGDFLGGVYLFEGNVD